MRLLVIGRPETRPRKCCLASLRPRRCFKQPSVIRPDLSQSPLLTAFLPGNREFSWRTGKPIALPAIRVYALPGGTVSFDVSRRGGTQFYVFDDREFCISELSCGVAPFVSEERVDAKGQLGILSDVHSSAMNICHFLLDNLTRVPIYRQCHGNDVRFLLAGDYPYYREILELSGLEACIVRPETACCSGRAELLLVSSNIVLA